MLDNILKVIALLIGLSVVILLAEDIHAVNTLSTIIGGQ